MMPAEPSQADSQLTQFADQLNDTLRAAGAGSAEMAFGIGFGIGMLPALVIILLLFVFKLINLILAFILVVMAALALVGVGMLLALQARQNSMRRAYQSKVEPQIAQYLAETGTPRQRFDQLASQSLPPEAPLQAFLNPPPQVEPPVSAEPSQE